MVKIDITPYCGSSDTRSTHLLALEIAQAYNDDKSILLSIGTEGWDIVENGIEQVVQEIADALSIPYKNIEFESADNLTKSNIFVHNKRSNTILAPLQSCYYNPPTQHGFGLFLGRGTNERLYAFWKSCDYKDSIRTLHLHPDIDKDEHTSDFVSFICEHNEKWKKIKPLLPYSDIGQEDFWYLNKDNRSTVNFQSDPIWKSVYDRIDIEIVCETNTTVDTFFITEKTTRPIFYGRLFLIIGSPDFEKNLKDFGFDIFDDILDKSYDNLEGYLRVDRVFKSMQKYLSNPIDYSVIEQRLKSNQKLLVKVANECLL